MTENRLAGSPLLYIHQPMIKPTKAPMQSNYHTPKRSFDTSDKKNEMELRLTKEANAHKEVKEKEREESELNDRTTFNEMSLKEKVEYLANMNISKLEHMPSIKCLIRTATKTYEGVITDYKDDHVSIRVGRRTSSTEVAFDEIKSIRLLGF